MPDINLAVFRQINRLIQSIRKKAADALFHEHQQEQTAADAIKGYADTDFKELRRLWQESFGGALPSNLGRHIHFWKTADFYDILRIDLPEIEAALDEAMSTRPKATVPSELPSMLHAAILKHGYPHLVSGDLHGAVLDSFIAVFDLIRSRTGRTDDGERLITGVFSEKNPSLVFSEIETIAGRDDQVGFMQILQGAFRGIRSPKAHSLNHDLTPQSAAQYLVFASLLARRVEAAVRREPTDEEPKPRGRPRTENASRGDAPEQPSPTPKDKYVSLEYVERAGITAPLRAEGWTLNWVKAAGEAEAIDLDGFSYVEGRDQDGSIVRYKVSDSAVGYLVLLKKKVTPEPKLGAAIPEVSRP